MKALLVKISTILALCIVLSGCQSVGTIEKIYSSQDPYHGGNYREAVNRWTRKIRIYVGGFDLELIAAATFKSPAFREAYTQEYARKYKLSASEKKKMLQDQKNAAAMFNEFMVSAFTPEKRRNDFNEKNTIWKVYLTRDHTTRVQPAEVRRIKNVDAVITHFYPYVSPWDVVYLLRFPKTIPGTREPVISDPDAPFKLVVAGVRGSAEMVWGPEKK